MQTAVLDIITDRDEKDGKTHSALTIDLIRLGSEVGIFIDGIRYAQLPTDPDDTRKFMILLDSFGTEVEITNQEFWSLND